MKVLGQTIAASAVLSPDRTESGIIIPDSARSKQQEVVVRAIGSGIKDGTEYTKGSRVFIGMYKGQTYKVGETEFFFADKNDVIGLALEQPDGSFRFNPIRDLVLLRPIDRPQGIIFRPNAYDEDEGVVSYYEVYLLGLGVRCKNGSVIPFEVKVGQKVVTQSNIGRDVQAAENTYKLVKQSDILAVLE